MGVRRVLLGLAVTGTAVFGFTTPAMAAPAGAHTAVTSAGATRMAVPDATAASTSDCYGVVSPDGGSTVCFQPYGEHLYVCDTAADGHHPGTWYWVNSGALHNKQYNLGNGYCHDINLSLAESSWITFQACNYEGSTELDCSDWISVSAKG